jgi:hypothetical protein
MMCPGPTTKSSTEHTHRYYRPSRREKYGKDPWPKRPLAAAAFESSLSPASGTRPPTARLAEPVATHPETLTAGKGQDFGKLHAGLATRLAERSANASRLHRAAARDLVEPNLGVEADGLAASQHQLRDLERDAAEPMAQRVLRRWSTPGRGQRSAWAKLATR